MNEPRPRSEAELIEFVRSSDVRAPEALHRRIDQLVAERSARTRPPILGRAFGGGAASPARRLASATALAAVAVAVLAIVVGGGGSSLSVQQATALTLSQPKAPAPRESSRTSNQLVAAVQGVHFPYWEEHFGWRSIGLRTDRLQGRTLMTVFYANRGGQQVGYAIVAGTAPAVSGGTVQWRQGTPYRLLPGQDAKTVVWLRDGHLCVLSGRGIDAATLLNLAGWRERASAA
jgi:hypothetical protein